MIYWQRLLLGLAVVVATLLSLVGVAYANEQPLHLWIDSFKQEARTQGVSDGLLDRAFSGFVPNARIIALDRKQPEGSISFAKYRSNTVAQARIREGQRLYKKHRLLLEAIGRQYQVEPRFILALWGMETSYGANTGGFNVVHALATLAYDGRRSEFFRKELLHALTIIQQGHISFDNMKGSWAGAMGHCQFMPSSFYKFAVDYDGDGHKNIWGSYPDIFASIANYLHTSGWRNDRTWGRFVQLPAGFDVALENPDAAHPLPYWASLGIVALDGSALPARADIMAALMFPNREPSQGAVLVYDNYHVLLKWNRSRYFATAVGLIADGIGQQ